MPKTAREQLGVDLPEADPVEVVEQEETTEGEDRPEWLPENFNSPEDLSAAYKEAQRKITEESAARKSLEERIEKLSEFVEEGFENQNKQTRSTDDEQQRLMEAFQTNPIETIAWLSNQMFDHRMTEYQKQLDERFAPQQQAQHELLGIAADQQMNSKYQDWEELKPQVVEMIEKDPALLPDSALTSPDSTVQALDRVYRIAKADQILAGSDTTAMKRQAQTMSGSSTRTAEPSEEEQAAARIVAAAKQTSYSAFRGG